MRTKYSTGQRAQVLEEIQSPLLMELGRPCLHTLICQVRIIIQSSSQGREN